MLELLFLLLPVSAFSGYYLAKKKGAFSEYDKFYSLPKNYFKGLNYLINEQPDKAVDVFLEMLELDDELIEAHLTLGSLFRRRGEVDRAVRIHQGLIARPNLTYEQRTLALLELARDYIAAGVLDRAENLLLELIELKAQLESSYHHLMNIYQQGKEWEKAIYAASQLQKISNENFSVEIAHFYCEKANEVYQQGAVEEAMKQLKIALQENYNCARASILQGDIFSDMGAYHQAIKSYQRVPIQQPVFLSEILPRLNGCYRYLGKEKEVLDHLNKYLNNPNTRKILLSDPHYFTQINLEEQQLWEVLISHAQEKPTVKSALMLLQLACLKAPGILEKELRFIEKTLSEILSEKLAYRCESCGFMSNTLQWLCPGCKSWDKVKPSFSLES